MIYGTYVEPINKVYLCKKWGQIGAVLEVVVIDTPFMILAPSGLPELLIAK
jgi:hypothetical protein